MLTKKDKIEYFKRECKNMHYYKEKVALCNERLEELANELLGDIIAINQRCNFRKCWRSIQNVISYI